MDKTEFEVLDVGDLTEVSKNLMIANEFNEKIHEVNQRSIQILSKNVEKVMLELSYVGAKVNLLEEKDSQRDKKLKDVEEQIFRIGHEPIRHRRASEISKAKIERANELYNRGIIVNGSRLTLRGIHGLMKRHFKEYFEITSSSMYNINNVDFEECLKFIKNYNPANHSLL
jgi:vacuolar-type H+-ATPase subunit I/STV1